MTRRSTSSASSRTRSTAHTRLAFDRAVAPSTRPPTLRAQAALVVATTAAVLAASYPSATAAAAGAVALAAGAFLAVRRLGHREPSVRVPGAAVEIAVRSVEE